MQFQWLTWAQAKAALAARLSVPLSSNSVTQYWTDPELGLMIAESLRTWNALTNQWNEQFDIGASLTPNQVWTPLSQIPNYPRLRTVTDSYLYTVMAYHLLENTASFSGQFSQNDFTGALQRRRDEILQASAANLAETILVATVGTSGGNFPDSTLSPIRGQYVPTNATISPNVLHREDDLAFEYFTPGWQTGTQQVPGAYAVVSSQPLAFSTDFAPQTAGNYRFVTSNAGLSFSPPAPTLVGIPDDYTPFLKWGAMGDLLSGEPEATDSLRADYCANRYRDGIQLMRAMPWLLWATIDGVPVDTPGVVEMDQYSYGWDFSAYGTWPVGRQALVVAGVDFVGTSPVFTAGGHSVVLNVVGNAPIPTLDADYVQVSRDVFDLILDLAQHTSAFKLAGQEFQATMPLLKNFAKAAMETNKRLAALGLYRDVLLTEGQRQEMAAPRLSL